MDADRDRCNDVSTLEHYDYFFKETLYINGGKWLLSASAICFNVPNISSDIN
jgi:hypothetical protein